MTKASLEDAMYEIVSLPSYQRACAAFRAFVGGFSVDTFSSCEIDIHYRKLVVFHCMEWPMIGESSISLPGRSSMTRLSPHWGRLGHHSPGMTCVRNEAGARQARAHLHASRRSGGPIARSWLPDANALLADKGYDDDWFRDALAERNITACIPSRANRKVQILYDLVLYKQRHKVENMFGRLKHWRRRRSRNLLALI